MRFAGELELYSPPPLKSGSAHKYSVYASANWLNRCNYLFQSIRYDMDMDAKKLKHFVMTSGINVVVSYF